MITNLWWLDGRFVIFVQLVWFLLFVVYVQAYMKSLNEEFYVLLVFNASKLFNPKNYPSDEVCITILEQRFEKVNIKSRLTTIQSNASRAELVKSVETLRHECVKKSLYETWQFCGGIMEWYTNWSHLMKLWPNILDIPIRIAICERRFSKQNAIKSYLRASLKLNYLDDLKWVSWCGTKLKNMDLFKLRYSMRN